MIDIVDRIRQERHEGGFVRKDHETGRWMEIGEVKAREKVGHAIRIEIKKRLNRKKYVRRSTSQASCSIASTYLECKEALSPPNQQAQGIFTACIEANLEPLVQQTCARPEVCTIVFPSQNEHEDHFSPRPLPLDDDKTVLESILQDKGPCPHASILSLSFKPEMKEDDALKCIYQIRLKVTTAKWQKA